MATKKRIIHLIISLERNGAEMALLRMLPHLNHDFESIIITLQDKGPLAPEFEKRDIRVIALGQKNILDLFSYWRLRNLLQKLSPDLILTNLLHADIAGRFYVQFFISCKVISSLVTTYNSKRYWIARLFEKLTRNLATGYLANAHSVKQAYVRNFGVRPEKIMVMPCGIDTSLFQNTQEKTSLKKILAIDDSDFVIICVASLHINKGHRFLLSAFEAFYEKHPQSKLLLVGDGGEKKSLLSQIASYRSRPAVLFLGKRTDVPALLNIANVFVLPTFFEGMSNAIMEAMANKLPVITTDIPENRELIPDQDTGILCHVGDTEALKKALEEVFAQPEKAHRLGEAGFLSIRERYDLSKAVSEWRNCYTLLTKKS